MPTLTRTTTRFVAAVASAVVLTSCSSTDDTPEPTPATSSSTPSATSTPTSTPSATPTEDEEPTPAAPGLSVTINGDDVQPNAEEIDLDTGERLTVEIQSDRAGELHVHSTPEQFIEFDAGTTSTQLVIETAGSVEVEEHDTGAVVALIEVR